MLVLTPALHVALAQPADAYCWSNKWGSGVTWVEVWAESNITSTESSGISAMAAAWTNLPSSWAFSYYAPGMHGPIYRGGYYGKRSFSANGMGSAPGVTYLSYSGSSITSANAYNNTDYTWNGVMSQANKTADWRTVTLHELGHWLSLRHPSDCGPMDSAETASAMNPAWVVRQSPNSDDSTGASALYP